MPAHFILLGYRNMATSAIRNFTLLALMFLTMQCPSSAERTQLSPRCVVSLPSGWVARLIAPEEKHHQIVPCVWAFSTESSPNIAFVSVDSDIHFDPAVYRYERYQAVIMQHPTRSIHCGPINHAAIGDYKYTYFYVTRGSDTRFEGSVSKHGVTVMLELTEVYAHDLALLLAIRIQ